MSASGDPPDTKTVRETIVENQAILDDLNARLARKTDEVKIIQQISSELNSTLELDAILKIILRSMDTVLGFEHGMILLTDTDEVALTLAASRGYADSGVGASVKIGIGVIGVVAKRRRMMRMGNIRSQKGYLTSVRAQSEGAGTKLAQEAILPGLPEVESQIAIPLMIKELLVGVFAVESERPNAFNELDEVLLSIVANQIASAIHNARLHKSEIERSRQLDKAVNELSALNETLEAKVAERPADLTGALADASEQKQLSEGLLNRMAPPEVVPLMRDGKLLARKIRTSILFADLENFTEFSGGMEADEVFSRLNHFFSWSGDVVNLYRGYVNKTNGDGLMALFGVPTESSSHATDAVLAAMKLQAELRDHFPLNMRIGINSGVITAGMLGPRNKSLYDVLGDPVNIASRMEAISGSGTITISSDTRDLVKPYFEIEALGEREVKGLRSIQCYQVSGIRPLARDDRRIDATSRFANDCVPVINEVNQFKREHLAMIDFVSLQSRDGALNHNEAVAAYALALLRVLRAEEPEALGGDDAVNEEQVLRMALLHDVGKHALDGARLNHPSLDGPGRDELRRDLLANTASTLDQLGLAELTPAIEELYRFETTGGADGELGALAELIAAADIYDAMTAPKLYKGTPWRISGALDELRHLPHCAAADRPIFGRFVELMKPADFAIAARPAEKVLIR